MSKIKNHRLVKIILLFCIIFIINLVFLINNSYCETNNVVQSVELNEENGWNENVTLPKYNDTGEVINYSIQEQTVPNGYNSSVNEFTITNNLNEAKVITRYFDKTTNQEIADRTVKEGYVGLEYTTSPEEIDGYKLVGNSGNISGTMTKNDIFVDYFYLYSCNIKVKHIDKSTNKLLDEENFGGNEGENLTSHSKNIPEYKLVEKPKNEEHKFTKEPQEVEYYYLKLGSLTINKIDKESNKIVDGVAKFEIYDENNNKLHFVKEGNNYIVSDDEKNLDYVETTDGQVLIKDIVVGKYKILEIKAPDGYSLSSNKKEIEITNDNSDLKIDIVNQKMFVLPLTGENSLITTIFVSFSLITIGMILFTYRKIIKERKK